MRIDMRRLALWALLGVLPAAPLGAAARGLTVDVRMGLESPADLHWSPDGSRLVFTVRGQDAQANQQTSRVWVALLSGSDVVALTGPDESASSPQWSPDGRQVALLSDRGAAPSGPSRSQIWLWPAGGGEPRRLTDSVTGVGDFHWSPDGTRLVFEASDPPPAPAARGGRRVESPPRRRLWTVEIAGGRTVPLTDGSFDARSPAWSPKGDLIAFVGRPSAEANEGLLSDLFVVAAGGGSARRLTTNEGPDVNPRWSPDGRLLAYLSHSRRQSSAVHYQVMALSLEATEPRSLTRGFTRSAQALRWSPDGRSIFFLSEEAFDTQVCAVAVTGGSVRVAMAGEQSFVDEFEVAPSGAELALIRQDFRSPGDVWVSRLDGAGRRRVTSLNPALADVRLATSEIVRWRSVDGLEIEGLFVRPLGVVGRPPALVVEVHGGPNYRFSHRFYPLWHILAARGFAVLAPNPRGSTGRTQEFLDGNHADWGGKDAQDVLAGVDEVIRRGWADPERLGVMGASYGGYMTAWLITQTPRFKAAIVEAGIANLVSYYGTTDIPRQIESHFGGPPWEQGERLRDRSPLTFVTRVSTPTLILHGDLDWRVPVSQGAELYQALSRRGVVVEFVRFPRAAHPGITLRPLREPADVRDWAERSVRWFDFHLAEPRGVTRQ